MEGKFDVAEDAERPGPLPVVPDNHIPELDVVVHRDEERLLRVNFPVVAGEP